MLLKPEAQILVGCRESRNCVRPKPCMTSRWPGKRKVAAGTQGRQVVRFLASKLTRRYKHYSDAELVRAPRTPQIYCQLAHCETHSVHPSLSLATHVVLSSAVFFPLPLLSLSSSACPSSLPPSLPHSLAFGPSSSSTRFWSRCPLILSLLCYLLLLRSFFLSVFLSFFLSFFVFLS